MAASDPVETETPVFTESHIYEIAGFMSGDIEELHDVECGRIIESVEKAIPLVLSDGQ